MRTIKLKANAKLKHILEERTKILEEGQALQANVEKMQLKQQKLGYKMNKWKDKTKPLVDKAGIELDEYEVITRVFLEKGEIKVDIANQLEEFKIRIKEQNENPDNEQ